MVGRHRVRQTGGGKDKLFAVTTRIELSTDIGPQVDEELKKIKPKDPKLMTARQRAMFERKTDTEPNPGVEQLVSLPSGYKEKIMTAEAIQKAALKSLKRKQLADEKREKDKVVPVDDKSIIHLFNGNIYLPMLYNKM